MRAVNLFICFCLFLLVNIVFAGGGTFPAGDNIKMLGADKLETGNSLQQLIFGDSDDPTSVAKNAGAGSLYLRTSGVPYIKTDAGSTTNWTNILDHGSMTGLTDDDHTQYLALAGRGANQVVAESVAFAKDIVRSNIPNPTFEVNTTGWTTYDDGGDYVNGIGGSPSALTVSRNTTTPLVGSGDFKISNSGNCAGEGVTASITIPRAMQAQNIVVRFKKKGDDANYDDGDMEVYLYDDNVTNSKIIEPANKTIYAGNGDYISSFQASPDSTSYRLSLHCTATSGAFDLYLDNIEVTQYPIGYGVPAVDVKSFTPTGTWIANTTYTGTYSRVGDKADIDIYISLTGAPTSDSLIVDFSSIGTIDTSKLPGGASTHQILGQAHIYEDGVQNLSAVAYLASSTTTGISYYFDTIAASTNSINLAAVTQAAPTTFGANDTIHIMLRGIPIVGWSSNAAMSSDFSNREIAASAYISSGTPAFSAATEADVVFNAINYDKTNSYNISNGEFTAPETGIYSYSSGVWMQNSSSLGTGQSAQLRIKLDTGSGYSVYRSTLLIGNGTSVHYLPNFSGDIALNKNNKVKMAVYSEVAGNIVNTSDWNYFTIYKKESPQTIFESESVFVEAAGNAGTVLTADTTDIDFIEIEDSHNKWNGTQFIAPMTGRYKINGYNTITTSTAITISSYIDGTIDKTLGYTGVAVPSLIINGSVSLLKDQVLSFRSDTTVTLSNTTSAHWITIERIK